MRPQWDGARYMRLRAKWAMAAFRIGLGPDRHFQNGAPERLTLGRGILSVVRPQLGLARYLRVAQLLRVQVLEILRLGKLVGVEALPAVLVACRQGDALLRLAQLLVEAVRLLLALDEFALHTGVLRMRRKRAHHK